MGEELNRLIDQLKQLRVEETRLIERIEALNNRKGPPERENLGIIALRVGDKVSFDAAQTTGSGTGLVIGFTAGEDPFVRIRRDSGQGIKGGEVKRKPHTIRRINYR